MSDEPLVRLPSITFGSLGIRSGAGLDLTPATQTAIDNALAQVPAGHGTAILEVGLKSVQAMVAVRKQSSVLGIQGEWTIGAYVGKPWSGPLEAGVRVAFSF